MKRIYTILISLMPLLSTSCGNTTETAENHSEPQTHIYLCFGQSNMEGSAPIEAQDTTFNNPRFQLIQSMDCENLGKKKGEWHTAKPTLSQCYTGLSPADYFGRTMIKNLPENVTVALINVAIGGSDIRLFDEAQYQNFTDMYTDQGGWFQDKIKGYGGNPYQRLISLAKEAQKKGTIKGILLHQGETNTGDKQWTSYVKVVYENMLKDLGLEASQVPLLAGQVVGLDQKGTCAAMNPIINTLPQTIPTAHVISSEGCTALEDNVHFDAAGVRELGKRYAEKMLSLQEVKILQ